MPRSCLPPHEGLFRKPRREDARAVFQLKRLTIGKENLRFTVFRSPLSVRYLEELLAGDGKSGAQTIIVLEREAQIVGYYMAGACEGVWFLNYIGVAPSCSGRGLGSALLAHFEQVGGRLGFDKLGLDVFENNPGARDWYLRRDYQADAARYFELASLPDLRAARRPASGIASLSIDSDAWDTALAEEKRRGFSNLDVRCGRSRILIGLIGRTALRIMAVEGMGLESTALALAAHFGTERKELILTGLDRPSSLPVVSREVALRMTKSTTSTPGSRESVG